MRLADSLYFASFPNLGLVKIGRSVNPQKRLSSGGAFCPDPDAYILAVSDGNGFREQEVHRAFARYHWLKEMFKADKVLLDWISAGCDFESMPSQFDLKMKADIPHRHSTSHIEALAARIGVL